MSNGISTLNGEINNLTIDPNIQTLSGTGGELVAFYDEPTFTITYLIYDKCTLNAVVIDSVLDFDPIAWQFSTKSVEKLSSYIDARGLKLLYSFETHVHADHISASQYLKQKYGCKIVIGANVCPVQETFRNIFDLPKETSVDGSQFDKLMKDGEVLEAGGITIKTLATPGHTPACVCYQIGNFVFTGDALFVEDCGSGRCDFPNGSAEELYHSIHERLYKLPDATIVCTGHDYPGGKNRTWRFNTTIAVSKESNVSLKNSHTKDEFVSWRKDRDSKLENPKLIFQSVQINLNAAKFPAPHKNGLRYLSIPINLKTPTNDCGIPL